jgi:hypothetical protein
MLKTFQFRIQKSVSDSDFLFTFNVYHMADKEESDLVMVSNESETDSNPRKRQGTLLSFFHLLVLSWINCYIISNECLSIYVDFRCVANHMQMWLEKKMVISHFGYWHFLSTANTGQDYVIKFVSDLRQVVGFLWVLQFPPPIKLTSTK